MASSNWSSLLLLLPALGVAGSAFVWLLFQNTTSRRIGWLIAVSVPAVLAGYSVFAVLMRIPGFFPPQRATVFLGLVVALGAGFLLDQVSSLRHEEWGLQGRRSPLPLLLWGVGIFLYIAAPALGQAPGGRPALDRWAGAVGLVGAFALVGQILCCVWRLSRGQAKRGAGGQSPAAGVVRRLAGYTGGAVAALLAIWLALPAPDSLAGKNGPKASAKEQSKPGPAQARRKAPANALLVNGMPKTSKKMALFVLDLKTGRYQPLKLAGHGLGWSHDGSRLAFTRCEGNFENLWIAAADGSKPRRLTNLPGHVRDAVWSADGRQIYFTLGKTFIGRPGLWVVPTSGGTSQEVLPNSEGVLSPTLSPDGRTLAYFRNGPVVKLVTSPGEIKLLDLSKRRSTLLVRLANLGWDVTGLTWTPDGRSLLASTSERSNGPYQLMRIPLAAPRLQPVGSSHPQYLSSFTRGPTGTLVLVAWLKRTGGAPEKREIWLVDPKSGTRRVLVTDGSVVPFFTQASPVGRPGKPK
jgi:hypothetical protein